MWSHLLFCSLQIILEMELHHKPYSKVYQKARLSKWMVSNKLLASCCASSKLLKLSLVIIRCNEKKRKFQIKYECPQELAYYQAKNPSAYIWQLDSPLKVCCNAKYHIVKFVMLSHCFSKKKLDLRYFKTLHANTIWTLLNL
jgi:hypothetical protein